MKILAEDGFLKPKIQIAGGLILAAWFLGTGLVQVIHPSNNLDIFFGVLFLCGSPGALYSAWYAYRKLKQQRR